MGNNGINISEIKCPGCGSPLKMPMGGSGIVRCEYCGGEYVVNWNSGSVERRRIPEWKPAVPDRRPAPASKDAGNKFLIWTGGIVLGVLCLFGYLASREEQTEQKRKEERQTAFLETLEEDSDSAAGIQETVELSGMLRSMIETAFGKSADTVTPQELSRIRWIADRRDFDFFYIGYSFDDPLENPDAELTWVSFPADSKDGYWHGYEGLVACTGLKKLDTIYSLSGCDLKGLKLESLGASFNTLEEAASAVDDPALIRELGVETSIDNLDGLDMFPNLEKISINAGDLSDVNEIIAIEQLKGLALENADMIGDFSFLASMSGLEELSIESENLKSLEFLKRMPQLRSLSLSEGQILDLNGIETLDNLESLSVTDCYELKSMSAVENLTGLRELELENPGDCEEPSLEGLTALRKLTLNGFYSCGFLNNLTGLEKLTLQRCDIPKNTDLSGLGSLKEFTCTASYQDLPLAFINSMQSLESVNLRGMSTYDDISGIFMLPHIKRIDITGIECEIAFDQITENASLETLMMTGVKLYENVEMSGGDGIYYVDWDDVYLTDHTDFFTNFPNLKRLEIGENEIKDLEFSQDLTKLEVIDFSDNYISEMRPLTAIPTLRLVYCKGNPIGNLRVLDESVTIINE